MTGKESSFTYSPTYLKKIVPSIMCPIQENSVLQCGGNMYLLQKKTGDPQTSETKAHELHSEYIPRLLVTFSK